MADEFKRVSRKEIGCGGMNCPCCGPSPGKERKKLRRRNRKRVKIETRREIVEQTE